MTTNEILLMIQEFLGGIVDRYLENSKVWKSPKANLAATIRELTPTQSIENLILGSYADLSSTWRGLTGQILFSLPDRRQESKYAVYLDELCRFISYNDHRKKSSAS